MSRIRVALTKLKCTNQEEKRVHFTPLRMTCISRLTSSENFPRIHVILPKLVGIDSSVRIRDANYNKIKMRLPNASSVVANADLHH